MAKVYTKAELFGKGMTLAKLQGIAEALEITVSAKDSKEKIANLVLSKQRDTALTTAGAAGSVSGITADEIAAANAEAAKSGLLPGDAMTNEGGKPAPDEAKEAKEAEDRAFGQPNKGHGWDGTFPDGFVDAVANALGIDKLAATVKSIEQNMGTRLREAEGHIRKLVTHHSTSQSLHGAVSELPKLADLPAPGKIDDLKKVV